MLATDPFLRARCADLEHLAQEFTFDSDLVAARELVGAARALALPEHDAYTVSAAKPVAAPANWRALTTYEAG